MVREVHDLLRVEACSAFLVPPDGEALVLAASFTDRDQHEFEPVFLKISGDPHAGLTGYTAHSGHIVCLSGEELLSHESVAHREARHLSSGVCRSVLAIPLKDRKGRVLGVLKVDNKKGSDGIARGEDRFTDVDRHVAQILANKTVLVLEGLRHADAVRELAHLMHDAASEWQLLDGLLAHTARLVGADRVALALWSEKDRKLRCEYWTPAQDTAVEPVWPTMEAAYSTGMPYPLPTRRIPTDGSPDAPSPAEFSVPLFWRGHRCGALGVAVSGPLGFDMQDALTLQSIGEHAAIALQLVGRRSRFETIAQGVVSASDDTLQQVLEAVRDIYHYDGALLYIADLESRRLWAGRYIAAEPRTDFDHREFEYEFSDQAFAVAVFNSERGEYSREPRKDPRVCQRGLDIFGIRGPLVGVPLRHNGVPVGALVAWKDRDPTEPDRQDLDELEPFARLAAAALALSASEEQRGAVLDAVHGLLRHMQSEVAPERILGELLEAVLRAGFVRSVVYERRDDRSYEMLVSRGEAGDASPPERLLLGDPSEWLALEEKLRSGRVPIVHSDVGRAVAISPLMAGSVLYGVVVADPG
ncbi:MAG: GAF domain-containing protein, partial [Candidatus Latescibacterota bacterium]